MQVNVRRGAVILLFFLLGLILIWLGMTGRLGLMLGAIFTPEYLSVPSATGSNASGGGGNG